MLRYLMPFLCLSACDSATDPAPGDRSGASTADAVSLQNVHSTLATCGGRAASTLTFEVVNDGGEPIVLEAIDVDAEVASGHHRLDGGLTVPAGGRLGIACVGGFSGLVQTSNGPSTAILGFTVDGVSATRAASGDHFTSQLWDFCDTGIPDQGPAGCTVVDLAE